MAVKKTNNIQKIFIGLAAGMLTAALCSAVGAAVANSATLSPAAARYIAAVCVGVGAFVAAKYAACALSYALYSGGAYLLLWLAVTLCFGEFQLLPLIAAALGVALAVLLSAQRKPNTKKKLKSLKKKKL